MRSPPAYVYAKLNIYHKALSGLTTHLTHNVSIQARVDALSGALTVPSCSVVHATYDGAVLTVWRSCVGSLIVVALVGSMALVLANCESCDQPMC